MTNNKGVYIPSIEAEEVYDMSVRGLEIEVEYNGMIPYSLELIKLRSMKGLYIEKRITNKDQVDEEGNPKVKFQSDAVINVKFKNKIKKGKEITSFVRGYDKLFSRLNAQLKKLENEKKYHEKQIQESQNSRKIDAHKKSVSTLDLKINRLSTQIEQIKNNKDNEIYKELKAPALRNHLYTKGFTYKNRRYCFYKRTSSKSRNSQALFILEELHKPMQEWSRMGLEFLKGKKYDVASLLAYESLVSSSIINTIKIKPKNIFIINDEYSLLEDVEAIEVGNDLKAKFNKKAKIENNIWDGQALIDISLMKSIGAEKYGMAQLRQHFFKCASFTANIQQFLKDKHAEMTNPEHKDFDSKIPADYDKWNLTDAYNNKIPARQILLLTTPSALKFMKFAEKGNEKEAYANWCKQVKASGSLFGICKHEKSSKYEGMQKSSYQMINTLDANMSDIDKLAKIEVDYIEGLQNDDDKYIEHLQKNIEATNSYEMFVDMYNTNSEVVNTKLFRNYRKSEISKYRTKVKGGKIRLESTDYCTVVSNPYEMLLSVVGKLKDEKGEVVSHTLHKNEVYTSLHKFNQTYTVLRNPHNAQNNFFKVFNKQNDMIEKYFNFKDTPNIIVITAILSPILVVCNGMDTDGDVLLVSNSKYYNSAVDKTLGNRKYPIIINNIKSESDPVELTNENISKIDDKLATSQRWIGEVTNQAQFLVSTMWDIKQDRNYLGDKEMDIRAILASTSVLVVLSNVAIDYAKKVVEVNIDQALSTIRSLEAAKKPTETKGKIVRKTRKKPKFWTSVTSSNPKTEEFKTPMDLLIKRINRIEKADYKSDISLVELMRKLTEEELEQGYDNQQIKDIMEAVDAFNKRMKGLHAKDHLDEDEKYRSMNDACEKINHKIGKKTMRISTIHRLFQEVQKVLDEKKEDKAKQEETNEDEKKNRKVKKDVSGMVVHIMNLVYKNEKEKFLSLIEKN